MARPAGHPVPQTRVLALTRTTPASPEALQATSSSNNVQWQCNICSPRPEEAEDQGLALTARRAQIGDGANARVHLSYELARPHIASDADGSPALRELLALNTDTVTAFSNDNCVAYVSRDLEDISELLAMPDVGEPLRSRLQHITPPEARALVEAWRAMPCRNASLIEFAPVLTRLVNCNTAPLMLGAGQSANYIIGASG